MVETRPEWWLYPCAAVAAAALVVHGAHGAGGGSTPGDVAHGAAEWALMVVAMMVPMAAPGARVAGRRALWSRRTSTVAWYAAGFGATWAAYGVVVAVALAPLPTGVPGPARVAVAALVALAWQVSRPRRRAVARCGPAPAIAAFGRRATAGAVAAGARSGRRCVVTCWASMLLMAAVPHPAVMGTVAAMHLAEWRPGPSPFASARRRVPALVYACLAAGGAAVLAAGWVGVATRP